MLELADCEVVVFAGGVVVVAGVGAFAGVAAATFFTEICLYVDPLVVPVMFLIRLSAAQKGQ